MDPQTVPRFENATVACMATYPGRFDILERSVRSIADQVDHLFIYVNNTLDGLPDLTAFANVTILDAAHHKGNISANGKVYPTRYASDCLIFTLDDDFIYPPDYVARLQKIFDLCQNRCCVAVHGCILPPEPEWYYDRAAVFTSYEALGKTQLINLAGSGTFAFHQSTLDCTFSRFEPDVQVDLVFSRLAQEQRLPIWCPSRPQNWLIPLDKEGLMQTMAQTLTHHTYEARKIDWSFRTYLQIADEALEKTGKSRPELYSELDLSQALISSFETQDAPAVWRTSRKNFIARKRYLKLLASA